MIDILVSRQFGMVANLPLPPSLPTPTFGNSTRILEPFRVHFAMHLYAHRLKRQGWIIPSFGMPLSTLQVCVSCEMYSPSVWLINPFPAGGELEFKLCKHSANRLSVCSKPHFFYPGPLHTQSLDIQECFKSQKNPSRRKVMLFLLLFLKPTFS